MIHNLYSNQNHTPYPLVNVYITMERSTIFHGKIHYFDWAIFNSYFVSLPEDISKLGPVTYMPY
jgi:hypothetical protein